MKSEIFDLRRFAAVVRRDTAERWKGYLATAVTVYSALLFGLLLMIMSGNSDSFSTLAGSFDTWFMFVVMSVGVMYAASRMMNPLKEKSGRIALLSLPASSLEKFVALALGATVGFLVAAVVATVVVDASYWLLTLIFGLGEDMRGSLTAYLVSDIFTPWNISVVESSEGTALDANPDQLHAFWLAVLASVVWQHSVFVLGSALWRKFPFVKTLGCLIIILFAVPVLIVNFVKSYTGYTFNSADLHVWLYSIAAVLAVWTVVNWIVSYRRFRGMQVVSTKRFLS